MKCEEREVICRDGRAALLRSAHPDDAAEMVRFLLDVCGETEFLLAYPEERQSLTDEGERTFLTRLTADDNELMLTAWVDGQLAGVANINFSTRLKMRHRANVAIGIRRAYWRLGLGTAMLTELVDVAKAHPEVRQVELEFIEGNSRAFRICFYNSYQGAAAAQYIKDNNMVDTVGILYQSDNDYSVGLYNAFVAKCGELGINIAETQTFTASTSTDFSTQVNALVSSGVKLVFIPFYAEEASTFLTQARGKFADGVYFFGADGLDGILGKVAQDPTIANNVLMLTPFSADNPAENVQSFVAKYKEAYGATPDQFAADAYDAVYVIKAAVEKAGSTSGDALAAAMTSLTVEGVTGTMTWGSDGNTNKPASAILYYDGVGTLFDHQD